MGEFWMPFGIAAAFGVFVAGCSGQVVESGSGGSGPNGIDPGAPPRPGQVSPDGASAFDQSPSTALHRLSRREFDNTLDSVFGLRGLALEYLPPDAIEPFDTDSSLKDPSTVFVSGMESLAFEVARRVSSNPAELERLAGCTFSAPDDSACLSNLATRLGRLLLRRPLSTEEVDRLIQDGTSFAVERSDMTLGARLIIQSLMQHAAFAHRMEIGEPDGALMKLDNYELVARLSYLLWATTPDDALLQRAEGEPFSEETLRALASEMVDDPRASAQSETFHQMWLGYGGLRVPEELRDSMLRETEALVDRALDPEAPSWASLFTSRDTFVDEPLARHYGMENVPSSGSAWLDYTHPQRAGILSHASFLSFDVRGGADTSPVARGKFIAERLLCWTILPPPPEVNADLPPPMEEGDCKPDAYRAHSVPGSSCYGCHQQMDPIGFGLERFDAFGRYREVETENASCTISGEGSVAGVGDFSGMRELVALLTDSDLLTSCGAKQYLHFGVRRQTTSSDDRLVERLARDLARQDSFVALVMALVSDPTFRYRVEE